MPPFMIEASKFCSRHLGFVVSALFGTMWTLAGIGIAFAVDITGTVSDNSRQAESTRAQLESHLRAESNYQREVRDIMRSLDQRAAQMQSDIAVLRERTED